LLITDQCKMRCHRGKVLLNKITNFFDEKSLAGTNKVAMQFTQCACCTTQNLLKRIKLRN
jgi:hypothetical protein